MSAVEELEQPQEVEQPQEQVSMEDSIRDTLREITSREAPDAIEPEKVPRDDKGKFAKTAEVENPADPEPEQPLIQTKAAPATWKREVAEKFSTLPPEVQEEIERRENDFHRGLEQYKAKAQVADQFEQAMQPYMATLQSTGVAPHVAFQSLLQSDHILRYGTPQQKAQAVQNLASYYGLNLGELPEQAQVQVDPNITNLQSTVQKQSEWINQRIQQETQRETAQIESTISTFFSEQKAKGHPYGSVEDMPPELANTLYAQIGALKQLNPNATAREILEKAYEAAIYANPTTRAQIVQQQLKAEREEASKKAAAAKTAASVNVRHRAAMPVAEAGGTMEDTIRAVLRRQAGA